MLALERPFRVLVVEDNRDLARLLLMLLKRNEFDAEAVHNGADAISAAERFRPDCVLSDIGLPGMDGYEVAQQFRSHRTLNLVPLIALSAQGDNEKARAAGFDRHLMKPTQTGELTRMLSDMRSRLSERE